MGDDKSPITSSSGWKRITTMRLYVGIYLMTVTAGLPYIWGNLNVYVVSYFHFRVNIDMGADSSWILSLNSMSWSIGMLVGQRLTKWIGFRLVMTSSFVALSTSLCLSYLAVQHSFVLLNVLLGVVCGFTFGLSQSLETILVTFWTRPKRIGIAVCSILSTQQIGTIVMSIILTRYINAENVRPDTDVSNAVLFSQPEILDNVPGMFVVFGCIAFGTGLIASGLVWTSIPNYSDIHTETSVKNNKNYNNNVGIKECESEIRHLSKNNAETQGALGTYNTFQDRELFETTTQLANGYEQFNPKMDNRTTIMLSGEKHELPASYSEGVENVSDLISHNGKHNKLHDATVMPSMLCEEECFISDLQIVPRPCSEYRSAGADSVKTNKEIEPGNTVGGDREGCDNETFTVKSVLKKKAFYVMVMVMGYSDMAVTVVNTYYKMFGLVYYPDDDFFTSMGVWMNVGAMLATWTCGLASDRFNVRDTMVGTTALVAVVSSFFYLSVRVDKWLYLVMGVVYNGGILAGTGLVPVIASRYIDDRHTATVQGMAVCCLLATNAALPSVVSFILSSYGWLELFTFVNILIVTGLFVVVIGMGPAPPTGTRPATGGDVSTNSSDIAYNAVVE